MALNKNKTKKAKNNNSLFFEYIDLHNKYQRLYGKNTVVIMQVGMFYEIYSLNDNETGPQLDELTSILGGILYTKKNKNVIEVDSSNPYMAGFPIANVDKYINILIKNKFTIIIVDQYDNEMGGNSKKDRRVSEIISPSTYIQDVASYKSNYLMSIYFYSFVDRKTKKRKLYFAISIIELSIGKVYLYEDFNKDEKLLFDNIYRIILKYNPTEIIIFGDDIDFNLIKQNLNLNEICIHNQINDYNKDVLDSTFQTELLRKVYKNTGMLNPIEYINLEKNQELLISFINLIKFSYSHNETIIEKINKPIIINNNEHLVLGYNLIKKLNIISENNNKFSSLLNILNNSSTHIGKRFFEKSLLNPLTNITDINERYDNIGLMLLKYTNHDKNDNDKNDNDKNDNNKNNNNKFIYEILQEKLKEICDLERFFRKIFLLKIQPLDFNNIYNSLKIYLEIFKEINNFVKIDVRFNKFNKLNNVKEIIDLIKFLENNLNLNEIEKYNLDNINGHIFKKGVYKEIDNLQSSLDYNINYFSNLAKNLNESSKDFKNFFKVEYTDQLGFYLQITQNRFNIFKRKFEGQTIIIKPQNNEENIQTDTKEKIKITDFTTKKVSTSSSSFRVFLKNFNKINEKILLLKLQIKEKCTESYKLFCKELYNSQTEKFNEIIYNIEIIDFSITNAHNSILYKYSRPIIDNDRKCENFNGKSFKSFLKMTEVRHPIIEIISEDIKYIANDIKLGIDNDDGILLYGMNSAGKSSLMKSIGLNIIMAQAGMYVACKDMKYYPYNKIYSRIPGGDDIFKGQSTFVNEISEIRNILKSADTQTLVIGDELCNGTETNSAIAIVSAGILDLIKKKCSFIFATHLHELAEMKRITEIPELKIKHLSVKYDSNTNILIFDRKLKDGSGDSIYGLEVCRSLDLEMDFIKLATTIRQEILGKEFLLKNKKSKYNSKLIIDKCNICKKADATETHHIRFQRDADENGFIDHFHKNKKFNLIGLCENCHDRIHNGELKINEAMLSSNGIIYS